jgi:Ca2+-transporting ATPase
MAVSEQLSTLDPAVLHGLTEAEAASRLRTEGFNELPAAKARIFFRIAWDVIREPMILLLISAAVIYFFLV